MKIMLSFFSLSALALLVLIIIGKKRMDDDGDIAATKLVLSNYSTMLHLYYRDNGHYPSGDVTEIISELAEEFDCSASMDDYMEQPYMVKRVEGKPVIYSIGLDGIDNGGAHDSDDFVVNYEEK